MASSDPSTTIPRVLIVSRRTIRKNKVVDFVGEYHLDLIIKYGAMPVIVPRVAGVHLLLSSFEPIHGVLLCEGEDIDSSLYDSAHLLAEEKNQIRRRHESDTTIDAEKDSIEIRLAKICLDRSIPFLGICRGSQVMNVACGGSLYQDLETERKGTSAGHINYENYDGHRHVIRILEGTPMCDWFGDSVEDGMEIRVNSYHHQGVKRLAERFAPMAFALDGLVEGFYDPDAYDPESGKFIVGLQFHPERMRVPGSEEFDYPGCPSPYQEFVKAVVSYEKKLNNCTRRVPNPMKFISATFSIGKNIYTTRRPVHPSKQSQLVECVEFLEANSVMSAEPEKMKVKEEREGIGRRVMEKMTLEQLSDLMCFYEMMGQICSQVLETKLQDRSGFSAVPKS